MNVDIVVVGWGKAGKTLAGKAAAAGKSVVVIERDPGMIGGACINVACIPTKTLLHSATTRPEDADITQYFLDSVAGRDTLIGKLNAANKKMLDDAAGVTVVMGEAEFAGPKTVRVADSSTGETVEISGEAVIINTGSAPRPLDVPGGDLPHVHTSISIQHLPDVPARLAIVGAGAVGLEFAVMFAGFGSDVTVIARSEVLRGVEPEIREAALADLDAAGVRLLDHADVESVEPGVVHTSAGDVDADVVLAAAGRVPELPRGLAEAGIELDQRGFVKVDSHLRTNVEGVFAAGDANGGPQLTYISLDDFRILAAQLLGGVAGGAGDRTTDDRVAVPHVIFLDPPLSTVGLTEAEAREQGYKVLTAIKDVAKLAMVPRPKTLGQTRGRVKVVVDADTQHILGYSHYGVDSQEVVNVVVLAMWLGATVATCATASGCTWPRPSSSTRSSARWHTVPGRQPWIPYRVFRYGW